MRVRAAHDRRLLKVKTRAVYEDAGLLAETRALLPLASLRVKAAARAEAPAAGPGPKAARMMDDFMIEGLGPSPNIMNPWEPEEALHRAKVTGPVTPSDFGGPTPRENYRP